jgi:transposase
MLYPLSYEGASAQLTCQQVPTGDRACQGVPTGLTCGWADRASTHGAHRAAVDRRRANECQPVVQIDDTTVALRLLVDRRDQLGHTRTEVVSRLHHLTPRTRSRWGEEVPVRPAGPGPAQHTVRPRDVVGKTRRWLASELIHELVTIDKKIKIANQEVTKLVASTGSQLQQLHGIGPSGAARLIGDIADIGRFTSRAHFASWNGTAPIDASSGDQNRHRLSRAGNRRINRSCTSWPSSSSATTPKAAATIAANSPTARPRWKPCEL